MEFIEPDKGNEWAFKWFEFRCQLVGHGTRFVVRWRWRRLLRWRWRWWRWWRLVMKTTNKRKSENE